MKIFKSTMFVGLFILGLIPNKKAFAESDLERFARSDSALLWALKSINYSPFSPPQLSISKEENIDTPIKGRQYTSYELKGESVNSIKFTVSRPINMKPDESLPIIVVVAGYQTGEDVVNYINEPGRNIIVGFDYSLPQRLEKVALKRDLDILTRTPIKISSLVRWLNSQSWADSEKINILSVSFGTFFVPAAQRILQMENRDVKATVLAYGGAGFKNMFFEGYQGKIRPKDLRVAAPAIGLLTSIMDPLTHLPSLRNGNFLIINGTDDKVIPSAGSQSLISATPDPKKVVNIDGGHINVDTEGLIDQLNREVTTWLSSLGAINKN